MELLSISKVNETYLRIDCSPCVGYELGQEFSYDHPGKQFMPAYKNHRWDGRIRMFNRATHQIYCGLFPKILEFAKNRDYEVSYSPDLLYERTATYQDAEAFYDKLKMPFIPHDYQVEALRLAFNKRRCLILSGVASGKTAILYAIVRAYYKKTRCLIVVPSIDLVLQIASDFKDYSVNEQDFNVDENCHLITGGVIKFREKPIFISTWQSIYELPVEYFQQFGVLISDEVHRAKANCLRLTIEKCVNAKVRVGLTGSMDDSLSHELTLTGLFGPICEVSTTRELIERKLLAQLNINCLVLKYDEVTAKIVKRLKYQEEIEFIVQNEMRNNFIVNLALSRKVNTLIIFRFVEKHGLILNEMLKNKANGRNVYMIYGGTEKEEREKIRKVVETEKDAIIVASEKIYSTGINIKNLDALILASPQKSKILMVQEIGRVLRKGSYGNDANVYDIVDDIRYKKYVNHALKHFQERVKLYDAEKYDYKIINVKGTISGNVESSGLQIA